MRHLNETSYSKPKANTRAESRTQMNSSVRSIMIVAFNKAIAEEINVRIRNPRQLPEKTQYQTDICQSAMGRSSHIVVNALAGSGKTTTLEHIVACFPGADARASTLHAFGMNSLRYHLQRNGIKNLDVQADKVPVIIKGLQNYDTLNADAQSKADLMAGPTRRLVDLARTHTFTSIKPAPTDEDLGAFCARYDVDLPDSIDTGILETEIYDLVRRTLIASNKNVAVIDFVDMIHLCLLLNVSYWRNDLILVDESQDLDPSQIMMLKRAANHQGQVIFVGDRNQAIYGFRSADVEAIESVVELFNAKELPLSTCWRCPTEVIKEAQKIVPQIEAAPNALEGSVSTLQTHEDMLKMAEAGDFVLCRTTAPLVDACMQFIRAGKAATVRGRDIGQGLEMLADKIKRRRTSKGKELIEALSTYREEQMIKLQHPSKEAQRQNIDDKIDTLLILSEECSTFDELKQKIKSIFSDAQNGELKGLILCSTAHKAKGLESERVFIIHPELMPHPMARQDWQRKQERNLRYVAITRSTRELYYVLDGKPKKGPEIPSEQPTEQAVEVAEGNPKKKTRKPRAARKAVAK
jgi:DNA helicase II / ATP-dependent DNA helicase PcrA